MQLAEPETLDIVAPDALAEALGNPAPIGPTVARLAGALATADVICIAIDEPRAASIAVALSGACPNAVVAHLSAPDALPSDTMAASPANIGARHAALHRLAIAKGRRALILGVEAALALVPPRDAMKTGPLQLTVGAALDPGALAEKLAVLGYWDDDRIDEPGETAVRGAIELYPVTAPHPVRLDIDDGKLVTIRAFDPVSQRSTGHLDHIDIEPAIWPAIDAAWVSPLTHLPRARVALDAGVDRRCDQFRALAEYIDTGGTAGPPLQLVSEALWRGALEGRATIAIALDGEAPTPRFIEQSRPDRAALRAITAHMAMGDRVVLAGSARDLRFLTRGLDRKNAPAFITVASWGDAMAAPVDRVIAMVMEINAGWQAEGLFVVAAADVLGSRAGGSETTLVARDPLAGAMDVRIGDVVLHEDHGLGILRGIESVAVGNSRHDAIRIEHAKGAQRLVPVDEADRLWRYGGEPDAVTLDGLDGASWAKRRGDIDAAIATSAKALTAFAAERAARRTAPITAPAAAYEKFVGRFPFTATRDQLRAIEAVRTDMASGVPMDRLIVGDVGYGKTEVALRAAAIAALAGRQVALIAPTTVLARQHFETFTRRFVGLDVTVAGLSRLSTAAEAKAVKAGLADGSIAVVIGTQSLTANGVDFSDLALVIIDEEQRFGAADKAKLRARADAGHVLTLTATPIPRTLQGALVGLQDISVIATPPARRQPIRTATGPFDADQLRTALFREKARGGQSFVVVPRIEDMEPVAKQLDRLVPDLVVHQAHGKMDAATIDAAMIAFAAGRGDVLLATNIIEAGLDVPRANTMVVMHADRFGLAQLHQLRGRVGRGARRGTILLLTMAGQTLSPKTAKRLKTLEALDHLGAGFAISAQDLDQRGAGDLVGDDQAGHVRLIGVDLYQHLLAAALAAARGETVDRWTPELHVGDNATFPAEWIAEEDIRLNLYLRLARLGDDAAVDTFAEEIEDRFGALPGPAHRLIAIARIRRLACAARIARVDAGPAAIALTPRPDFRGDDVGLESKGGRFLLRGAPGPDPLGAVIDLLERVSTP